MELTHTSIDAVELQLVADVLVTQPGVHRPIDRLGRHDDRRRS